MVLSNGIDPIAEPPAQRFTQLCSPLRMLLDDVELLVGEATGFVQDFVRYEQLPHVVEEARPLQQFDLGFLQLQLVADDLAVRADSLGVTAGQAIVCTEVRDQLDEGFGGDGGIVRESRRPDLGHTLFQLVHRPSAQGSLVARWRPIGEHERQLEQGGQRQQASRQLVDEEEDARRDDPHRQEPRDRGAGAFRAPDEAGEQVCRDDRHGDRRQPGNQLDAACEPRLACPSTRSVVLCLSQPPNLHARYRHQPRET